MRHVIFAGGDPIIEFPFEIVSAKVSVRIGLYVNTVRSKPYSSTCMCTYMDMCIYIRSLSCTTNPWVVPRWVLGVPHPMMP
jgi:hypothetical protein